MRQTPDFSGTWTLHLERSRLEIEKPTTTVFVIEHRDPALRVTRTHVYGDVSDTLTFELTTDGRSSTFRHRGIEADMRARWKGDELVITMELHLPTTAGHRSSATRWRTAESRSLPTSASKRSSTATTTFGSSPARHRVDAHSGVPGL